MPTALYIGVTNGLAAESRPATCSLTFSLHLEDKVNVDRARNQADQRRCRDRAPRTNY
jgi:hypothetical protein